MIKSPELLAAFEDRQRTAVDQSRTYHDALGVFAALWQEARAVNPELGNDWEHDVLADINIARALRGLPPAA